MGRFDTSRAMFFTQSRWIVVVFGVLGMTSTAAVADGTDTSHATLQSAVEAKASVAPCPLPICDIEQSLKDLELMKKHDREQYLIKDLTFRKLLSKYGKSENSEVWSNILSFGLRAKALFEKLEDEDFVIKEAAALIEASYLGVHKYGPLTVENLSKTFAGLTEGGRNQAAKFWERVEKFEDFEKVKILLEFLIFAKDLATKNDDPVWILDQIDLDTSMASARLTQLDPILEGSYTITLTPMAPISNLCPQLEGIDTLIMADSMTTDGEIAALMSAGGTSFFFKNISFSAGESKGLTLASSDSISFRVASRLRLEINREGGEVTGFYSSTQYSCLYKIQGKRLVSPGQFMRDQIGGKTPVFSELPGIYDVSWRKFGESEKVAEPYGSFILQDYPHGKRFTLSGSFLSDPRGVNVHFQFGYYVAPRGLMILTSNNGESDFIRWHLAYRPNENGEYAWRGFNMSMLNHELHLIVVRKRSDFTSKFPKPALP